MSKNVRSKIKRCQSNSQFTPQEKLAIDEWLQLGKLIERLPYIEPVPEILTKKRKASSFPKPKTEAEKLEAHKTILQKHAGQEAATRAEIQKYLQETKGRK